MTGKKQEGSKDPESETQLNLLRIVKEGFVVLGCILNSKLENMFYLTSLLLSNPENQKQMTAKERM